jgi:hypothetical protein
MAAPIAPPENVCRQLKPRIADSAKQAYPKHRLQLLVEELHDEVAFVQVGFSDVQRSIHPIELPELPKVAVLAIDCYESVSYQRPSDRLG